VSKFTIGNAQSSSRAALRVVAGLMATMLVFASPAQAAFSEGYKFLESVKKKEGEKVEQALMDSPTIVNARDVSTGETALHIVVGRRDLTWLQYLVMKGASVNQADDHGRTPLQQAINLGWREGAEYLVEQKANTEISNDAGETPLISAVHRHDAQLMKVLLQAGADPDRADNSGRSARDYASQDGDSSNLVATINTFAKKDVGKNAKPVYGPVF